MEEALYLANLCQSVTLIHRRNELRASRIMQERALRHEKIQFLWNTVVEEVLGNDSGMTGLRLKNLETGEVSEQGFDGLFIAIGHTPNTKVFEGQLQTDANGYLTVQPGSTQTSVPGVFAAGDVADSVYRQAVTAAGTGCMAAIDAERWLAEQEANS